MRSPPSCSRRRRARASRCTTRSPQLRRRGRRAARRRAGRRDLRAAARAASRATAPAGRRGSSSRSRPTPRSACASSRPTRRGEDNPALEPLALACFYVVDARRSDAFGCSGWPPRCRGRARSSERGGAPRSDAAGGGHGADPRLERAERRAAACAWSSSCAADSAGAPEGVRRGASGDPRRERCSWNVSLARSSSSPAMLWRRSVPSQRQLVGARAAERRRVDVHGRARSRRPRGACGGCARRRSGTSRRHANSTRASQSPVGRSTMCSSATVPRTTWTAPTEPSWSWKPVSAACFQPIA